MLQTSTNTSSATSSGASLECTTCLTKFDDPKTKRMHMRDDWHVYNLKRRIASLPPISLSLFNEKVIPATTSRNPDSDTDEKEEESSRFHGSCDACEQSYTNKKAWNMHLKSRKHIQRAEEFNAATALSVEEAISSQNILIKRDEDDEDKGKEPFDPLQCLFCPLSSLSISSNLTHMSQTHNFFIPNLTYLIDTESLLSYLFILISDFHECLWCGSEKGGKLAVQDHMRSKGHCKVDFEDGEDFGGFWDFGDGKSEEEGDEIGVGKGKGRGKAEGEREQGIKVIEGEEMRLPSGKTLGHRSRARFFRQNHISHAPSIASTSQQGLLASASASDPSSSSSQPPSSPDPQNAHSNELRIFLRANTSTSLIGVPELQQRALRAVEMKMEKIEMRAKNEYQSRVEKKGNQQKNYRVRGAGKKQGGLEKVLG